MQNNCPNKRKEGEERKGKEQQGKVRQGKTRKDKEVRRKKRVGHEYQYTTKTGVILTENKEPLKINKLNRYRHK